MAQIERGEARIQRRISIKKALDTKVLYMLRNMASNEILSVDLRVKKTFKKERTDDLKLKFSSKKNKCP